MLYNAICLEVHNVLLFLFLFLFLFFSFVLFIHFYFCSINISQQHEEITINGIRIHGCAWSFSDPVKVHLSSFSSLPPSSFVFFVLLFAIFNLH